MEMKTMSDVVGNTSLSRVMSLIVGVVRNSDDMSSNSSCFGYCSDFDLHMKRIVTIVVPTVFGVIFLCGLVGNTVVILVVAIDRTMRTSTNVLIQALALADLLFILFCLPFSDAFYALLYWPFSEVWCQMEHFKFVSAYACVYTLVLMTLDPYLAVVHAVRSTSIRNQRNTWLAVALTWVIILLSNTPLLPQYHVVELKNHRWLFRSACINTLHQKKSVTGKLFHVFFMTFGYAVPLGAVCLMYGLMLKRIHNIAPGGAGQSEESVRAKRRVTRIVVTLVLVFTVCWLPLEVTLLLNKLDPSTSLTIGHITFVNCLAKINSCVNPFLYAFLSQNFRKSFRKVFCCSR